MPPKKKKGKKKGKKGETGELSVKDKYNKTLQEVDSLKHELETRTELARRNNAKANDLKLKVPTDLYFQERNFCERYVLYNLATIRAGFQGT